MPEDNITVASIGIYIRIFTSPTHRPPWKWTQNSQSSNESENKHIWVTLWPASWMPILSWILEVLSLDRHLGCFVITHPLRELQVYILLPKPFESADWRSPCSLAKPHRDRLIPLALFLSPAGFRSKVRAAGAANAAAISLERKRDFSFVEFSSTELALFYTACGCNILSKL